MWLFGYLEIEDKDGIYIESRHSSHFNQIPLDKTRHDEIVSHDDDNSILLNLKAWFVHINGSLKNMYS